MKNLTALEVKRQQEMKEFLRNTGAIQISEWVAVAPSGEVFTKRKGRHCGHDSNDGYKMINVDGKVMLVHRLVAELFIPNPENLETINHKNGVKHDNRVCNLEWMSLEENIEHAFQENLHNNPRKPVAQIDVDTNEILDVFISSVEAARQTNVGKCNISRCCNGRRQSAGGYRWMYLEAENLGGN